MVRVSIWVGSGKDDNGQTILQSPCKVYLSFFSNLTQPLQTHIQKKKKKIQILEFTGLKLKFKFTSEPNRSNSELNAFKSPRSVGILENSALQVAAGLLH